MLKLWQIYFTYGEHEAENEIFVHDSKRPPSTITARRYLLKVYGGAGEYMDEPKQLTIEGVYPYETANDVKGNPYKVVVQTE